jgi:hypothetical protein
MLFTQDFAREYPVVSGLLNVAAIFLFAAFIWIFGRMSDNINKIRKMLEEEIKNRR